MGDITNIATEMRHACNEAETSGVYMDEYETDFNFPDGYKARVQAAMDRWENGCADLHEAAKQMEAIAAEVEGDA